MGMVYQWKPGARVNLDPQVTGERLEKIRLRNGGNLTPDAVVKDARRETSPLHPAFEWNDRAAAEKYREAQAGHIIRTIAVVVERGTGAEPVATRAFVSVRQEDERHYTSVAVALSDPTMREQVLANALRELEMFRQKYEGLEELAPVFEAMGELLVAA